MRAAMLRNAALGCLLPTLLAGALVAAALAQPNAIRHLRGVLQGVTADALQVDTRHGETVNVAITDNTPVVLVAPVPFSAIKPGSFIGTAALPGAGGTLRAMEVHVFAEDMRGAGEGHRPWGDEAEGSMTNGTVGEVTGADGRTLHITYKGGEQTVLVPDNAPVVAMERGSHAALKPGAHVSVSAEVAIEGALAARFVMVGKDGTDPPL